MMSQGLSQLVIPLDRGSSLKTVLAEHRAVQFSTCQARSRDILPVLEARMSGFLPVSEDVHTHPKSILSSNSTLQCEAAGL